jgi:hypothetical protein
MFNKKISLLILLFAVLMFFGCGNGFVPFGGKVTTPDDQPYTKGYVIFSNGKESARGKLQSDGTYILDSLRDGDGLSPGNYQVYLADFKENIGTDDNPIYHSDIDLKYENPETSGLSCEVKKGGKFDFIVDTIK